LRIVKVRDESYRKCAVLVMQRWIERLNENGMQKGREEMD
jgi:hypothetical protein